MFFARSRISPSSRATSLCGFRLHERSPSKPKLSSAVCHSSVVDQRSKENSLSFLVTGYFFLSFTPPAAPKTHRTVQKPACNNGAGRQKPKAKNQPSGRSTETQHPPQPTYQLYFSEPLTVLERCDCTETAPTHFFTYQLSFSERVMAKETFGTDGWVDGVDFFGGRNLDFSQKNCIITIDLTTQVKPI